ncbi:MAG: hypothetical protein HN929_13990 [Chloroflexi bacterium]|nr:hypothetical protein [Chloroflexota bacterium]
MAWIRKGNQEYYYRSRWQGSHVISEYVGNGPLAELSAEIDQAERQERIARHKQERQRQQEYKQAERIADQVGDLINMITQAAYLATGHYTHKRQWRKRQ